MAGSDRSTKDKQMASRLKADGVERWDGRCPICYKIVRNAAMHGHITQHAYGGDSN